MHTLLPLKEAAFRRGVQEAMKAQLLLAMRMVKCATLPVFSQCLQRQDEFSSVAGVLWFWP